MAGMNDVWNERRMRAVAKGVFNITPFFIAKAEGALLTDVDGKEYIDFAGGIGTNNLGHRHPAVLEAIRDQLDKYLHPCFHVTMYEPYVELAEKLNGLAPCRGERKTMLANSGAEAVENAVKIARCATRRPGVICFENAFHGRTTLAMALTSKVRPYKLHLGADLPHVHRARFPYCYRCPWGLSYPACDLHCGEAYFEQDFFKHYVDPEEVAAIILEPVQGEGGFITPPGGYLGDIRKICDRHGIVLIADEIQTGFGRTGKLFALEHFGVEADIVTMAKSMGGGLPISAVTGTGSIMDSVHDGGVGGTYGGNPVACRAALAVIKAIEEEGLLGVAEQLGRQIRSCFDEFMGQYSVIGEVRGLGPMLALELVKDRKTREPAPDLAKALTRYCRENGLIILDCGTLGNNIRTLMPLTITEEQLSRGMAVLEQGLASVSK